MPHDHTRLIAALTTAFGVGQIVGPLTAAWRSRGNTASMRR